MKSVSAYKRKHLAQYSDPTPPNKKIKTSHSPSFNKMKWEEVELLHIELTGESITCIWSTCARQHMHGIVSKNGGQIVKRIVM